MNIYGNPAEGPLHPAPKPKAPPKPPKPKGPQAPPTPDWEGKKTWARRNDKEIVKRMDAEELYRILVEALTDAFTDYFDQLDESENDDVVKLKKKTLCIEPEQDSEESPNKEVEAEETEEEESPKVEKPKTATDFRKRIMARARAKAKKSIKRGERE